MPIWQQLLASPEWGVAGLLGAILSVRLQTDLQTLAAKLWHVALSTCVAYYLTPVLSDHFGLGYSSATGVAFLLGLYGAALVVAGLRAVRAADLWAIVRGRFGGPNP